MRSDDVLLEEGEKRDGAEQVRGWRGGGNGGCDQKGFLKNWSNQT